MKLVLLVFTLLVLLPTAPAIGWNEPDTFRGVPWGAPEDVLKAQTPSTWCGAASSGARTIFGERFCSSSFTVGDVPVKALLWFRSGAFVRVTFTFDPTRFSTIEGAFRERYGEPTSTKEDPSKTRGGLEFVNVEHEWHGTKVFISLRKYAGKITESRAMIQTAAERQESFKRFQEGEKKGASDL
jgi:hypothetical protein